LPWIDLKYRLTASSASNVAPEATTIVNITNTATRATKYIVRVLIIQGGLIAAAAVVVDN
jgi:hypothetical protein